MAAGKISIQANDGKVAGVVFEDGASSNVTVTIPKEGGVLATQTALNGKQGILVSGTSIKTINSTSLLGSGNISITETAWTANDSRAKTALNATGTAPIYACRAWVNFNGTGTVAIRASGNVSSITDNGAGDYSINFTTAMPDANYAMTGTVSGYSSFSGAAGSLGVFTYNITSGAYTSKTASAVRIATGDNNSDQLLDYSSIDLAVFR